MKTPADVKTSGLLCESFTKINMHGKFHAFTCVTPTKIRPYKIHVFVKTILTSKVFTKKLASP